MQYLVSLYLLVTSHLRSNDVGLQHVGLQHVGLQHPLHMEGQELETLSRLSPNIPSLSLWYYFALSYVSTLTSVRVC
jgi:hypothetical protein